jgi:outer membrane biosynthesis protein TonB
MHFGRLAGSLLKHRSGIIGWKLCCWIPLVSFWASRPISTFALQSGHYICRYSNSNSNSNSNFQYIPKINSIMPRRSSRVATSAVGNNGDKDPVVEEKPKATRKRKIKEEAEEEVPVKKASPTKKKTTASPERKSPAKKAPAVKGASKKKVIKSEPDEVDGSVSSTNSKTKKNATKKSPAKKKAGDHQRVTEREELPKLWNADKAMENGSYS